MLDIELARAALRTRAAQLVVATTGSVTLAATAAGYTRTTGSFVTDLFAPGMEVTPAGFTQTTPGVVTAVTATLLSIDGGRAAESAGAGRSLSVGLPNRKAYENTYVAGVPLTPKVGAPYIVEMLQPGASRMITMPANGGLLEEDVLSRWNWYFPIGAGTEAIDRTVKAFKKLFTPGTNLTLADSTRLKVRGDTTVKHSNPVYTDTHAVVTITIPCRAVTHNAVAA